ncbi:uncharacterized protein LOC6583122 isoform X1 [Drosophila mojavensis]|uniref:uncharacterized protein LOC6583122 isoform X1 n=1 Tax=Drosophila mojavensis TaxID=7230 RepID=UPI0013EE5998|nr:uncharacterized protein LOC6583122 isoform X1 [Drosophila mojavensis]
MEHSSSSNNNSNEPPALEPVESSATPTSTASCDEPPPPPPPTLATQITSIDGFFNRKRGRPPKNRFVEVYKSAQQSPQAIFTSFKLEKNDPSSGCGLASSSDAAEERPTALRLGAGAGESTATDLTPSRSRKRARIWTVDLHRSPANVRSASPSTERTSTRELPDRDRSPVPLMFTQPAAVGKPVERVSVVRAAGTFYPENASSAQAAELTDNSGRYGSLPSADCSADQPEDLSMRTGAAVAASGRGEPETKLLQFKQLLDLYQRQVLLPSFLAAASQPAALDMRLLLENAAQQKMLLINAAAAGAVAAAAAAAAASATAPAPAGAAAEETMPAAAAAAAPTSARAAGKRARDQDIPTGYLKFRFNEDCGFERCGYRNHQSHFHCNRRDCHYSFCDKTRFVQHTARHERMDSLMGEDFRQYRANMRCGVPDCCYATQATAAGAADDSLALGAPKKSSHFHCRKCDYVCTDSNKVVAHRRLHLRLEYVRSAGFRKIASNEPCDSPGCTYALRHTHYHCTTCDCSVLSRAQLASHRHRTLGQAAKQLAEGAAASSSALDVEAYP